MFWVICFVVFNYDTNSWQIKRSWHKLGVIAKHKKLNCSNFLKLKQQQQALWLFSTKNNRNILNCGYIADLRFYETTLMKQISYVYINILKTIL